MHEDGVCASLLWTQLALDSEICHQGSTEESFQGCKKMAETMTPSAKRTSLRAWYLWQDVPTRLVGWITKNTCHLFSVWHRRGMFACDLAWGSQR